MASNSEREILWNQLSMSFDRSEETAKKLAEAIPPVRQICRFRTVNRSSLDQLQSNRLEFSSADYYDDPFDTYFYIDYELVHGALEVLKNAYNTNGPRGIASLLDYPEISSRSDSLLGFVLKNVNQKPPDVSLLDRMVSSLRGAVQKSCFSISFCDNPLNESLWLKYANSHKGFVQVYELADEGIVRCGKSQACEPCMFNKIRPTVYPVYYSDERYDATRYALAELALKEMPPEVNNIFPSVAERIAESITWEIERISLIKKKCHEHDGEWRMICPLHPKERPAIGMKPTYIAIGMKMPEYERRLVISASEVAGIQVVYETYIDKDDHLAMRQIK